jgi:hemoglobin
MRQRPNAAHDQLPVAVLAARRHVGGEIGFGTLSENTISLYEAIGGAPTVDALTRRFYDLMDSLPEAARCRAIHPPSLEGSRAKLYDYLTGYLGGTPLYIEKHGHPRLRSRHFMAAIGPAERDEWLICFRRAMEETIGNEKLRVIIWEPIERLAHHMQNREQDAP